MLADELKASAGVLFPATPRNQHFGQLQAGHDGDTPDALAVVAAEMLPVARP